MSWRAALYATLLCAACAGVAGCGTLVGHPTAKALGEQPSVLPAQPPLDKVLAGTSSKDDVLALLGTTRTVQFDSGYEVWAYRYGPDARSDPTRAAEFVVLFAPTGLVAKTRLRLPEAR